MSKYPDLNGIKLALLRALDRGEVRGIRVLSGKGRRALHPGASFWPAPVAWALGGWMLGSGVTGCAPMPLEQPRALLMGAPVLTGLAQVRDPQSDTDYFVPCNPCAAPTSKTPMLGSTDVVPEVNGKPAVRQQHSILATLDVHTAATLAMPADGDAVQAGSAQLTNDLRPVTVVADGLGAATPITETASTPLFSLPFPRAVAILNHDAKRGLSDLLPLAMKAERVFIRGYTDSTGTAAGNRVLAIARAATVRAAFVRGGVAPQKLKVSYCVTCFVASNDNEAGRSANRRVEVELVMSAPAVAARK